MYTGGINIHVPLDNNQVDISVCIYGLNVFVEFHFTKL